MGGISANSRTNLIFVPSGVKINSKTYRELILDAEVKGFGCKNFGNTSWTFQQDGAPAHTANATQQWFRDQKMATLQSGLKSYGLFCLVHLGAEGMRKFSRKY
ncbi:hypothetical protein LOD99_109 [Oopsacas minuta]|uniref:Transposase n=1 Tax=Oopsacas minuta TaxID=111878 RepID=A0AAV7K8M1_9METZ|nr:hypothetical protein LOD99_109 [Oopsacas minuta]